MCFDPDRESWLHWQLPVTLAADEQVMEAFFHNQNLIVLAKTDKIKKVTVQESSSSIILKKALLVLTNSAHECQTRISHTRLLVPNTFRGQRAPSSADLPLQSAALLSPPTTSPQT